MDIILSFPSLNRGCHYKDFPMDGLKKNMIILFEGDTDELAFPCDRQCWCIKLCIALAVFGIFFRFKEKAIFKTKV